MFLNEEFVNIYEELSELNEWVDAQGKAVTTGQAATTTKAQSTNQQVVYAWDMYIDPADKGTWLSAYADNRGIWDGFVFKTDLEAVEYGDQHLQDLEAKGRLKGDIDDYSIDTIEIPISKVSIDSLRFSGF